jgi:hypothetical protein
MGARSLVQDKELVVFRDGKPAVSAKSVRLDPLKRFTFFDQVHTTGAPGATCGSIPTTCSWADTSHKGHVCGTE